MADLIERYKITANLPSVLMNYCNRFNSKQLESITEMIYELENSIESADVQPVKHGRCVIDNEGYERCSVCNEHETCMRYFTFCPQCGAKLDGDTK